MTAGLEMQQLSVSQWADATGDAAVTMINRARTRLKTDMLSAGRP